MTAKELRESKDYKECLDKIKGYRKGFTFEINYSRIPTAKANALRLILRDFCDMKLIQSTSIGLALTGEIVEESYRRI